MTRIANAINKMTSGDGSTEITFKSWCRSDIRWGRNTIGVAEDSRDNEIYIARRINGAFAFKTINQVSTSVLKDTINFIERLANEGEKKSIIPRMTLPPRLLEIPSTSIWSDKTALLPLKERAQIAESLISKFKDRNLLSSGFLEWRCLEGMSFQFGSDLQQFGSDSQSMESPSEYIQHTQAQCSMTAFKENGDGIGWAGLSSFDWSAIDCDSLAHRAIDRCIQSSDPGHLDPGEYTAILEPQAASRLIGYLVAGVDRFYAEQGRTTYSYAADRQLGLWRTRLGMKMLDERITIGHDPSDPMLGVLPKRGLKPVVWFENGRLVNLAYDQSYARQWLGEDVANLRRPSYRMEGGPTSIEEMIESTEHGVVINDLSSDLVVLNAQQLIMTGYTKHNMLEIKGGRISRAIRDMRFTDSPLLAFNLVEAIGPAVPIFAPAKDMLTPAIVPTIKVKRFALTTSTRSL